MLQIALVALGGAAGAVARYATDLAVHAAFRGRLRDLTAAGLPVGTLAVNAVGCLAIGFVMHLVLERQSIDDRVRLLVVTGFLGSLTTFSAFGFETFRLVDAGRWPVAAGYALVSFAVGLAAVFAGWSLASLRPIAG